VALAIHTGIHWRHWLDDPVAMATASEILTEVAEATPNTRKG
jgi:hypothetical protein